MTEEKAAQWSWALALLRDLLEQRMADVLSFNAATSACERSQQWQRALELFKELPQHHLRPTEVESKV